MFIKLLGRVGGVALGTAVGHGLVVLATPLLARLYSPEEFGLLALLMTVSNISVAAGCFRYDLAMPSAPQRDLRGLIVLCIGIAFLSGIAATVFLLVLNHFAWAAHVDVFLLSPLLAGASVAFSGAYQATSAWFLHQASFGHVSWLRFSQGAIFSVSAMLPGIGLAWAHVLSFIGGLYGLTRCVHRGRSNESSPLEVMREYRAFPKYSLPGALLDVVGFSLCLWVINAYYGHGTAGNYSQVQRLVGAPLMLMSISLGQVLLKQTAELSQNLTLLRRCLLRLLALLVGTACVALVAVWLFGEPLLRWFLGPQWQIERQVVTCISVAVFVRACVSPLSTVLVTLRRLKHGLLWQALYFISAVTLMPWFASRLSFSNFVVFFAFHEMLMYLLYLIIILVALRDSLPAGAASRVRSCL